MIINVRRQLTWYCQQLCLVAALSGLSLLAVRADEPVIKNEGFVEPDLEINLPAEPAPESEPVKLPLAAFETPEGTALLTAWTKAGHKFTPEVKSAYLTLSKAQALAKLAKAGKVLPQDFLDWVDSLPGVAATVYGIEGNGAQRLVLLRSLELDVGKEEARQKHLQLVLAMTNAFAGQVNLAIMSNPAQGISLDERGLLKIEIKRAPQVRIDTHAKDRTLDINDHIINFLEANPITPEKKVTKTVAGKKVESVEKSPSRPRYAYEVYSDPNMVTKFNDYLTKHGFPMNLDVGKGSIVPPSWGGAPDIGKAAQLFRTAYEAKGLLPKKRDPKPTPGELTAYLIRNDNFRFPAGSKQQWPKFNMNSPWPVLGWLVKSGESLREREYVWKKFVAGNRIEGYGQYIGKIAQYPAMVKARKLQPFDFSYDTYPMRLKDGGVCGTCSNIGRFSFNALGTPANQAAQPAHSNFVTINGSVEKGFGLTIHQSVAAPKDTVMTGGEPYFDAIAKFYPLNYGFREYLDARMGLEFDRQLPATTTAEARLALRKSVVEINPYNREAVTSVLALIKNAGELADYWQSVDNRLKTSKKPGCPPTGHYNGVLEKEVENRLAKLPLPESKDEQLQVLRIVQDRADGLWLKYQVSAVGLSSLKQKLEDDLKKSVARGRNPEQCQLLANRLTQVGGAIKDTKERKEWSAQLLAVVESKEKFTAGEGRAKREYTDPCVGVLKKLKG
jgi:hypothetical protein